MTRFKATTVGERNTYVEQPLWCVDWVTKYDTWDNRGGTTFGKGIGVENNILDVGSSKGGVLHFGSLLTVPQKTFTMFRLILWKALSGSSEGLGRFKPNEEALKSHNNI
jgi:hypothetical protein